MHKHYIYRSDKLIATLSGECLIDMLDNIKKFITEDVNAQNNFSKVPDVCISNIKEGNEAVFIGSAGGEQYTYIVKSVWQA